MEPDLDRMDLIWDDSGECRSPKDPRTRISDTAGVVLRLFPAVRQIADQSEGERGQSGQSKEY